MKKIPVWIRYALFALAAMAANLIAQWAMTAALRALWSGAPLRVAGFSLPAEEAVYGTALAAGTAVGFFVKYFLDKNFIFYYRAGSARAGLASVFLYGITAVFTTLIFWGVQGAFTRLGEAEALKYLGGFLGLVPGYTLKYFLDKRFVFKREESAKDG